MREFEPCGICHTLHSRVDLMEFDDVLLCPDCLREETVICSRCGSRLWEDDNAGNDCTPLCQSCYDRYYTTCTDCGRLVTFDDAYYVDDDDYDARCHGCHREHVDNRCIHDYYFKPAPVFYGSGDRYFGIELEVDGAGERENNAGKILDVANRQAELVYIKHDGSLDDGFEIVSHPATPDYHLNYFPWAEILKKVRELGYTSHQAGTCGLHIHVGRVAFGATHEEKEASIARLLFMFELFWNELLKFSRRTPSSLRKWACRYGLRNHPKEILDHAKTEFRGERYTAVNLTNSNTVELRMWRGTLKYNTFIATIQLVNRLVDCACYLNDEEVRNLSWTSFVAGCAHYPELVNYLRERRLYVNEPVEAEMKV